MKNVFAYYNLKGRLIRVKEDTLSHFKDITPHSVHPLKDDALKASYIAWRDGGKDDWKLIGSYDFFADSDEVMNIIQNFKGVADYRKPIRKGSKVTPELREEMRKRYAAGESMYRIAQLMQLDKKTVRHHVKETA